MKGLSDWQLMLARDALRAYYRYERDHEGLSFTWRDVREAIAVHTGVEIGTDLKNGAERLRQFVEGVGGRGQTDSRKYPVPKPEALEAIVAFLTHEDVQLLTESDLHEHTTAIQAPLRLTEYLKRRSDKEPRQPLESLEGHFRFAAIDNDEVIVRDLVIQRALEGGILQVFETVDFYDDQTDFDLESLSPAQQREQRFKRDHYGGWAILTPEFGLLFFLKEEHTGINRYYITLASDLTPAQKKPVSALILLQHDYPFAAEGIDIPLSDESFETLFDEFHANLYPFARHSAIAS